AGGGINSVGASGTTITVTATEADTLTSVLGRGATTTTAVALNGGLTSSATGDVITLSGAGATIAFTGAGLSQITTANQNLALIPSGSGNVGIGTSSPNAKLEIAGSAQINGNLTSTGNLQVNGTIKLASLTNANGLVYLSDSLGTLTSLANGVTGQCLTSTTGGAPTWASCSGSGGITGTGISGFLSKFNATGSITTSQLFETGSGNVGLGTSAPSNKLS